MSNARRTFSPLTCWPCATDDKPQGKRHSIGSIIPKRQVDPKVALLTGGGDKPYVVGLVDALTAAGIPVEIVGGDELDVPELLRNPNVIFLNLRGDQRPNASFRAKVRRVAGYYWRLIAYAAGARPGIFHILWNNKFQTFDRTLLMLYYRLLGKKIILTAHNVNTASRDGHDSDFNRFTLKRQYSLCDHIFVHTEKSKNELKSVFAVPEGKITIIPFGINNTLPKSELSRGQAKQRIGVSDSDRTLLFFGQIAPYKGLDDLVAAFTRLGAGDSRYRLIIAGKPKWSETYWREVWDTILAAGIADRVVKRIEHIGDDDVELYFKAADVLVLPYRSVYQSGVLFLAYSFGLPVIASDVGSLKDDVVEGKTGFVCQPANSESLADTINCYFESELFTGLARQREFIHRYANERYSWTKVANVTGEVYSGLLAADRRRQPLYSSRE